VKDSPAARAGFKSGDVILRFDGKKVTESRRLPRMVAETDVGKKVQVDVWRSKSDKKLWVKLGELEKVDQVSLGGGKRAPKSNAQDFGELGLSLAPISDDLAKRFKLADDVEGVLVTGTKPDSAAAEKGLRPGTVIVEVNQVKVKTPRDFAKALKKAKKANQKSVLLLINEGGETRFIGLKRGKD